MSAPIGSLTVDQVSLALRKKLEEQPWWKKNSNTVTTALGGLVTLLWWASTSGLHFPAWGQAAMGVILYIASVLGVKYTRNGLTASTVEMVTTEVEQTYGRHAR